MDKVKPVMPYVVSSYLDKEEETWLKGNESQRAWAAVNAQEEAKAVSGGKPLAVPKINENPPPEYKKLNWFWKWLVGGPVGCEETLQECFNSYSLAKFHSGQVIDSDEFDLLVGAVYYDLKSHNPSKYNPFDWWVRSHYDTPFWNGTYVYKDPNTNEYVREFRNDTVVSIDGVSDKRSDINYFAQGMWDAAMGRSLEESIQTAKDRKDDKYGEELSERTIYWITYGYEKYQDLDVIPEGLQP